MKNRGCIIVAGGSGQRMGTAVAKQYLEIGGAPIIDHTLHALRSYDPDMALVLVVPAADVSALRLSHPSLTIVSGGATRSESVWAGLQALPPDVERVGVHDGVRPFVSHALLSRLYDSSAPAVIPIAPCTDSIRLLHPDRSEVWERSRVGLVQTPQVFATALLLRAYNHYFAGGGVAASFTDDASLVEGLEGVAPTLVEGDELNIKITTPKDMALGEWIYAHRP